MPTPIKVGPTVFTALSCTDPHPESDVDDGCTTCMNAIRALFPGRRVVDPADLDSLEFETVRG